MNELNKAIDKLNQLQAQNLGLMIALATLARRSGIPADDLRAEFDARAAIFQTALATSGATDPSSFRMQRSEWERVRNTVFLTGE